MKKNQKLSLNIRFQTKIRFFVINNNKSLSMNNQSLKKGRYVQYAMSL